MGYIGGMDPEKVNYHYCEDLPTTPLKPGTRVLVTGANGYVAHRLIPELIERGYTVRCMFRTAPSCLCSSIQELRTCSRTACAARN